MAEETPQENIVEKPLNAPPSGAQAPEPAPQEEQPQVESQVETPPEEAVEEDQAAEAGVLTELLQNIVPELADTWADLAPDVRERILLNQLAAQRAGESSKGGSSEQDAATAGQEPSKPSVKEIPPFDPKEAAALLAPVLGEQEAQQLLAVLKHRDDGVRNHWATLAKALQEVNGDLQALRNEIAVPFQLKRALPEVAGAKETDIPAAKKLLGTEAGTPKAALTLAVAYRLQKIQKAQARPVGNAAQRKAQGLRANRQSGQTQRPGATPSTHIGSMRDIAAEMQAEEDDKKK